MTEGSHMVFALALNALNRAFLRFSKDLFPKLTGTLHTGRSKLARHCSETCTCTFNATQKMSG